MIALIVALALPMISLAQDWPTVINTVQERADQLRAAGQAAGVLKPETN